MKYKKRVEKLRTRQSAFETDPKLKAQIAYIGHNPYHKPGGYK